MGFIIKLSVLGGITAAPIWALWAFAAACGL